MSDFAWSFADSNDRLLTPGDVFEIRRADTAEVVYSRTLTEADVQRGGFDVPSGVLENNVTYQHRIHRQTRGGWSPRSVFEVQDYPQGTPPA